jgi:hypothetical protein
VSSGETLRVAERLVALQPTLDEVSLALEGLGTLLGDRGPGGSLNPVCSRPQFHPGILASVAVRTPFVGELRRFGFAIAD